VAIFARSLPALVGARPGATTRSPTRCLSLGLGSLVSLTAVLLAIAAPAGAVVTTVPTGVGTEKVAVGLQPSNGSTVRDGLIEENEALKFKWFGNTDAETFENAAAGPVLHDPGVYVIYWDPQYYYHGDWQGLVDKFVSEAGSNNGSYSDVFAVDNQYTDRSNRLEAGHLNYMGAYTDTHPYPSPAGCIDPRKLYEDKTHKIHAITCLSDGQIRAELKNFITTHNLVKGMNTVFYMLTPPGVAVCLDKGGVHGHCSDFAAPVGELEEQRFEKQEPAETLKLSTFFGEEPVSFIAENESYKNSFCSYHSDINEDNAVNGDKETVVYGVIPWTAGGVGDGQLAAMDRYQAYFCQDGGFTVESKPTEQREGKVPPVGVGEEEEIEELRAALKVEEEAHEITAPEAKEIEDLYREALLRGRELNGLHVQEPNQAKCPTADGYCDQGLADLIVNQLAVEQQNIATDPLLNGWQDVLKNEATDECRNFFAPRLRGTVAATTEGAEAGNVFNQELSSGQSYYLNDAFNLAALKLNYPGVPCLHGIVLEPSFTATNPVNNGEQVAFNGMESNISLNAATDFAPGGTAQSTYAVYTWNFGDSPWDETPEVSGYAPGAPVCEGSWVNPEPPVTRKPPGKWIGCAASVFHSYKYGGTYDVTLTVTDVGGDTSGVVQSVTVNGPPAVDAIEPASGPTAGGTVVKISGTGFVAPATVKIGGEATAVTVDSGSEITATTAAGAAGADEVVVSDAGGSSTGGPSYTYVAPPPSPPPTVAAIEPSPGSTAGPTLVAPLPTPEATTAVVSQSLRTATRKGLVVDYSVSEQVTGHFQVLLATSVAKRIGLRGPAAAGLPAGIAPQTVIGKAILVTTKGGHSKVTIQFSKTTAADLRRLHKVSLMLLLVVRNATTGSATVIKTFTLKG